MRRWSAGKLGKFVEPTRSKAVGSWLTKEASQWLSVDQWPILRMAFGEIPPYVDTTARGKGTIEITYTTTYPEIWVAWEKAVGTRDASGNPVPPSPSATWTYVPPPYYPAGKQPVPGTAEIYLTGRLRANDDDYYRCVLSAGLKVLKSSPVHNQHDVLSVSWPLHPADTTVADSEYAIFKARAEAKGVYYGRDYTNEADDVTGLPLLALYWERSTPNLSLDPPTYSSYSNFLMNDFPDGRPNDDDFSFLAQRTPENSGLHLYRFRARAYIKDRVEPFIGDPVSLPGTLSVTCGGCSTSFPWT